ncbi:MAG TPA: O-antigen ligase family protein [Gaiellaceae bacterium]|nr:O-antigen ligase family protein [Gaiellaceae bacterium]
MHGVPSAPEPAAGRLAEAMPGVLAVALLLLLGLRDAGFQPTLWYPVGLALLVLLALVLLSGVAVRPPRTTLVALGAFAGFTLWCFASITWSEVQGDALEGANRTLVYLVAFALFALMPVPRGLPVLLVGLYATGVALIALATVARAQAHDDPASFFIGGRLAEPAGYANAAAALFLAAYWAAVTLAARRSLPPPLRGILAGAATALLGTAVLCQSRGSVFAFAAVCLVQLVLVPGRARSVVALALTGGAVAAVSPILLDVFPALAEASVAGPVRDALVALLAATLAAGLIGWLLAVADARTEVSPATARRGAAIVLGTAALAVVATGGWAVATGSPVQRVADGWDDFTALQEPSDDESHLASGLGSNRYDFWRVALGRFADRPLTGVGVENFAVDYVRERRSWEEPLHPHSLEVRVLSQTGVPGATLFAVFLGAAALACLKARGRDVLERMALLAGVVAAVYWLGHATVDWFWAFPGLTLPALAWLGLGGNGSVTGGAVRTIPPSSGVRAAVVPAGLVAAAVLAVPWLAVQETRTAATGWPRDPERALDRLERARTLNPLTDDADVVAGIIAGRRDDVPGMLAAYGRAVERNPSNWFAHLELGLAAAEAGRVQRALGHVRAARRLNPREPLLAEVEAALRGGDTVDRRQIEQEFADRAHSLSR